MGFLDELIDGFVDKAKRLIDDEVIPAAEKIDRLATELEGEAEKIRARSHELVKEAERERERERRPVIVEAEAEVVKELKK